MDHYFLPLDGDGTLKPEPSPIEQQRSKTSRLVILQQYNNEWAQRAEDARDAIDSDRFDITTWMPPGGIFSSAMILTSTTVGAGLLSIPVAFYKSGMGKAVIYLALFGAVTVYSYTLLAIAGMRTGYRSYHLIVQEVLGPAAGVFAAVCFLVYCFAVLVSCITSIGQIAQLFFADANENLGYLKTTSGRQFITSMVWMLFMLPLCMPRKADGLKYFSLIAVLMITLFVLLVVVHYCQDDSPTIINTHDVHFAESGNAAIYGLSTFIFSFTSQTMAYSVFEELYKPSPSRLTLSAIVCVAFSFVLYLLIGIIGYLQFGSLLEGGSILTMYDPSHDAIMAFGYVLVAFKLCVSYGLYMMGLREGLYFICKIDAEVIDGWKHVIIVSMWALGSLICALFVPDASSILDAAGASCGGFIAYILPALMAMYTGDWTVASMGAWHYVGSNTVLVAGVVAIVFSTGSAIYYS